METERRKADELETAFAALGKQVSALKALERRYSVECTGPKRVMEWITDYSVPTAPTSQGVMVYYPDAAKSSPCIKSASEIAAEKDRLKKTAAPLQELGYRGVVLPGLLREMAARYGLIGYVDF